MKNPEIYDFTCRDVVEVDDLMAFSAATYTGAPYLQLGLVTRFTPKRVYYVIVCHSHSSDDKPHVEETWTPRRRLERWSDERTATGRLKKEYGDKEFINAVPLMKESTIEYLHEAERVIRNVTWGDFA